MTSQEVPPPQRSAKEQEEKKEEEEEEEEQEATEIEEASRADPPQSRRSDFGKVGALLAIHAANALYYQSLSIKMDSNMIVYLRAFNGDTARYLRVHGNAV